ncbi:MAG: 30S ribosomal protein S5 [Patescibacteria group bacterium]
MADEKSVQPKRPSGRGPAFAGASAGKRGGDQSDRRGRGGGGRGRGKRDERAPREFEQKILDLARVTRVTSGGKRMSFRCALVIGDKKGKVGLGVAKGGDVQIAIEKAYKQAKKSVLTVPLVDGTIPHAVLVKFGSAVVLLKSAPKGTGLKSGGAVRMVLEFAGVPNAISKILNSSNKINIAKATLEALKQLRTVEVVEAPAAPVVEATQPQPVIENA